MHHAAAPAKVEAPEEAPAQGLSPRSAPPPRTAPAGPSEDVGKSRFVTTTLAEFSSNAQYDNLHHELQALLPAAAHLYGYEEDDVAGILDAVRADRSGGAEELARTVRQWRIDLVAAGLDDPESGLIGLYAAHRARIQFRMDIMGKTVDENGSPYSLGMLDWREEPKGL